MVIVVSGENDFARLAELKSLVSDFESKYGDFGLERVDASVTEMGRLLESVASVPFLSEKRMIILSNIMSNKDVVDGAEKLLESVSDETILVIDEQKFDKRLTAYKILKKKADFREFKELDGRGLASWLVSEAKYRGGNLSQADAVYLVDRAGPNQLILSHELDKLLSFSPSIKRDVINELVEPLPMGTIFDLMDAAFSGDKQKTMRLYDQQRRQQVEPQAIMGMIGWQVHTLTVVKFNEHKPPEQIASSAKINPYVVRKTLTLTSRMTTSGVKDLVRKTLELDSRLKSESIDADDAVQHFLLTI